MIDREMVKVGCVMGLLAMLAQGVKYLREHSGEVFDKRKFVVGMISAAFVGLLAHCVLRSMSVGPYLSASGVAMAGYCGGSLLDVLQEGILEWVRRIFQRSGKNGQA